MIIIMRVRLTKKGKGPKVFEEADYEFLHPDVLETELIDFYETEEAGE